MTYYYFPKDNLLFKDSTFLHLIKPIEVGGVFHPITRHLECVVQTYKTISVLNPAIKRINEKVIDEYGIAAQNRLMACGIMYEE